MSFVVVRFDLTPNPNAIKCILDRAISVEPRSFRSLADAAPDPVAAALFAGGATGVLMNGMWIAVNKAQSTEWEPFKKVIIRVLREAAQA